MNTVRIIGGIYKGKKLHFPSIEGLRPTADRVKETLFNWLMHDIRDAKCLDAFAGSGNLGFEALSRGAAKVVLIESNNKAYEHLIKTANDFKTGNISVYHLNTFKYLETCTEEFDIIFLDPPFAKDYVPKSLSFLTSSLILKKGGLLYLESGKELELDANTWEKVKSSRAGQVVYGLYRKIQ